MTVQEQLNAALQHHQSGRWGEARSAYERILANDADCAEALHGMGLLDRQEGHCPAAAELIRRAIAIKPTVARYHLNMGAVLDELGRLDESIAAYEKATSLNPKYAGALSNLGDAYRRSGRLKEAVECCRKATELQPNLVQAFHNLGRACMDSQSFAPAAAAFGRVAELQPGSAQAYFDWGTALVENGSLDEAVRALRKAVELQPDFADAHSNLGRALFDQWLIEEAMVAYRRAIEICPDHFDAHNNLGAALWKAGRIEEGIVELNHALKLRPDSHEALTNLGCAHQRLGEFDVAARLYKTALEKRPEHPTANWNSGLALLLQGDFEHGWPKYQYRWQLKEFRGRTNPAQPLWDGGDLRGRRIVLHAEQGFGDAIQFVRYLPLVAEKGGRIILAAHGELHRLFRHLAPLVGQWVEPATRLPSFDVHAPLMSLPMIFKTTLHTIPATIPYLSAEAPLAEGWKSRLRDEHRRKVGLVWAGRASHVDDRQRSIAPQRFAPLANAADVAWFSLQKGAAGGVPMQLIDWTAELTDFAQTAALIANLDLIVCVDTAVAHLAGAMGKPVWLLLPYVPDWRWLLNRADSPWYPTMRIFRQRRRGDWEAVIEQVGQSLLQ